MYLELEKKPKDKIAIINDLGDKVSYGDIIEFSKEYGTWIGQRCVVFILCENSIGGVLGYFASVENKIVPLMLDSGIDKTQLSDLIKSYNPAYLWVPTHKVSEFNYEVASEKYGYTLLNTGYNVYSLYEELALLLTTSGSTGSPKLVRHSYKNLQANAHSVSESFKLKEDEVAMISLPIHFTQGLSTVRSNLYVGGTILVTTATLMNKEFWTLLKDEKATSFTGVPYSYDILQRLRFTKMDLPALKIINQGGGRLTDERFKELAEYALDNNKKFIATYGSTETTSRMAFLPPELAINKSGSIGMPMVNGRIDIVTDDNKIVTKIGEVGEIVYYGPNVTLGYAECKEDLQKGDERQGAYQTGDMAYFDEDECIFIVGRKKRFLKLFGYRIGLDETERMLKIQYGPEVACVGTDKQMIIYTTYKGKEQQMVEFLQEKTHINSMAFSVRTIDEIPKNTTGKIQYNKLENM